MICQRIALHSEHLHHSSTDHILAQSPESSVNSSNFKSKIDGSYSPGARRMDAVFKKLNLKNQKQILVLDNPYSFEMNLDSIQPEVSVVKSLESVTEIDFVMIFVTTQEQINRIVPRIAPMLSPDPILWMCYPKGTSKKYKCDFNRDTGWAVMGNYDLAPVRMVAIDEDWSALRFKKVDFIKKMTRSSLGALSEKGKVRVAIPHPGTDSD